MSSSWNSFNLTPPHGAHAGGIAAVSRIPTSMEVWWVAPNGSVRDAFWYEGGNWSQFELAPPGSAAPAGIAAVSRIPASMEVWWIAPNGSVQGAFWYEGGNWGRYELAPAGSAAPGAITAVSRIRTSMEVWWVAPNGSVQGAFWYEGGNWGRYELARAGSAAPGAIKAVSRIPQSMEVWWVAPNGSVRDAFWYEGGNWGQFELAPPGSAAPGGIAAVSRIPTSMEVWWVAPNGSVRDAYWYEGGNWSQFELAPPGSAAPGGITAVSRMPNSMEVWWIGQNGSVQDAYWYDGSPWNRFELMPANSASRASGIVAVSRRRETMELWFVGSDGSLRDAFWYEPQPNFHESQPKVFSGQIRSGGLAALGGWMEVSVNPDGSQRWRGHAHDSGADGYDFGVSAIVRSRSGRAIAFVHHGHVGGTFTSGSRNHDWDETHPPHPLVAANFDDFFKGTCGFSTGYSSDFGSAAKGALGFLGKFLLGSTPIGSAVGLVVFIGVEVGSLMSTGSLVPGARVVEGILWLAGPSNMLLALAAGGIASAGSRTRELTQEEYDWANNEVYQGALPPRDRLVLTDTIGASNRAFTFPRFDGKISLNMGPEAFGDPRNFGVASGGRTYGEVYIHELCHSWQIHHAKVDVALLADALASRVCEVAGVYPYAYGDAGPPYDSFNLEQQAQIVSDWFCGRRTGTPIIGTPKDTNSPYFRYIVQNIRAGMV